MPFNLLLLMFLLCDVSEQEPLVNINHKFLYQSLPLSHEIADDVFHGGNLFSPRLVLFDITLFCKGTLRKCF